MNLAVALSRANSWPGAGTVSKGRRLDQHGGILLRLGFQHREAIPRTTSQATSVDFLNLEGLIGFQQSLSMRTCSRTQECSLSHLAIAIKPQLTDFIKAQHCGEKSIDK